MENRKATTERSPRFSPHPHTRSPSLRNAVGGEEGLESSKKGGGSWKSSLACEGHREAGAAVQKAAGATEELSRNRG